MQNPGEHAIQSPSRKLRQWPHAPTVFPKKPRQPPAAPKLLRRPVRADQLKRQHICLADLAERDALRLVLQRSFEALATAASERQKRERFNQKRKQVR